MIKVQNDRIFSKANGRTVPGSKTKMVGGVLIFLVGILLAANVSAATWRVVSGDDRGSGSLREAINRAQSGDLIIIDASVKTIFLQTGELYVPQSMTIEAEKSVTITSNNTSRAFFIPVKVTVTLSQVSLTQNQSGDGGGAIYNAGVLNLNKVYIYRNNGANGGAIYSTGTLNVDNSTIAANIAGFAGGISIAAGANETRITNTTVAQNRANSEGGGIALRGRVNYINHCTISENAVGNNSGGGLFMTTPNSFVGNTALVGNQGNSNPDLSGPLNSQGFNLIGDATGNTGVIDVSDLVGLAPNLGPLQLNGGFAPTYAPLAGSPLIDAGDESNTTALDQTGQARLQGFSVDIGAVEYRQTAPQTIVVQNGNDAGPGSLREAVSLIQPNGVITFAPSVTLVDVWTTIPIQKNLIINGPGTNNLLIRGPVTRWGDGELRVFSVSSNVSARISKLSTNYVGINNDGTLFLTDVQLTQLFFNNYGVVLSTGYLMVNNSVVADGRMGYGGGGGIAAVSGKMFINNSYIRNNGAYSRGFYGGGIYLNGTGRINKSTIAANWTNDYNNFDLGGGIYTAGGTLSIINSTIDGNDTDGIAGAIYAAANSSVSLLNSTITRNTYTRTYLACAVYSNSNVSMKNTLIYNPADFYGAVYSSGNNFVSNSNGGSGFVASDILNITPTISALGFYGGPTPTVKPSASRFTPSPINTGSNNFAPPTDQRGNSRFAPGNIVDIGAYETP